MKKFIKKICAVLSTAIVISSVSSYESIGAWEQMVGEIRPNTGYQSSYRIKNYPVVLENGGYYGRWYTNRDRSGEYYIPAMQALLCIPVSQCDGALGSQTESKIKEFQERHGLTNDGIIGKRTFEVLMRESELTYSNKNINKIRSINAIETVVGLKTTFSYFLDYSGNSYESMQYYLN